MTSTPSETDWATSPSIESLVDISTATLHFRAAGPARQPRSPVVIFEAGAGGSSLFFNPVIQLLARETRIYAYERAGIGRSPAPASASRLPRTAGNMAAELRELLRVTGTHPPWVLVAHSYAGIIAREFLHGSGGSPGGEVAGLVLLDANQERTFRTLEVPFAAMGSVLRHVDLMAVLFKQPPLTEEEMVVFQRGEARPDSLESEEQRYFVQSSDELAAKRQLETTAMGDRPVVVIKGSNYRDVKTMIDAAGPEAGTAEDRAMLAAFLERVRVHDEDLQREQLNLSTNSRFVLAKNSGHHVQTDEPELVADEIRKVVREVEQSINR